MKTTFRKISLLVLAVCLCLSACQKAPAPTPTPSTSPETTQPSPIPSAAPATPTPSPEPTPEVAAPRADELYKEVLEQHCVALTYDWDECALEEADLNYMIRSGYPYYGNLKNVGYTFIDINRDGIDELLIGNTISRDGYNDKGNFLELYTIVDGAVKQVVSGGERDRFYLTKDMTIENEGSSGADSSSFEIYRMNQCGELDCVEDTQPFYRDRFGELIYQYIPFEEMAVSHHKTIPQTLIQSFSDGWEPSAEYCPKVTFDSNGTAHMTLNHYSYMEEVAGKYKVYQCGGNGQVIALTLESGLCLKWTETTANNWVFSYDEADFPERGMYSFSAAETIGLTIEGGAFLPAGAATVNAP